MGKIKDPQRVKLVIGMLAKDISLFDRVEEFFIKKFKNIDFKSSLIPFDYTDYYKDEMGHPLKKKFISFERLISQDDIVNIKLYTNQLENKFLKAHKRQINLDPGYLTDAKFILATTKDYFHRIYLAKGIYAEVTLFWRKGSFSQFEWTYPDHRSKEYIDTLNTIRDIYMKKGGY